MVALHCRSQVNGDCCWEAYICDDERYTPVVAEGCLVERIQNRFDHLGGEASLAPELLIKSRWKFEQGRVQMTWWEVSA